MKISLNWLKEYIDFNESDPNVIAETLTVNSAEIEKVTPFVINLEKMVVGKIEDIKDHPNADKLKICMVNDGNTVKQIVCGGTNLRKNMLVAYAKVGAQVKWHGEGDEVTLEKAKIRGEESFGMILSSEEIGLSQLLPAGSKTEIIDLSDYDCTVGQELEDLFDLNDFIFEIDNTALTHRPDLFSHRGFARECVANRLGAWKKKEKYKLPATTDSKFGLDIVIKNPELAPRYCGAIIKNVPVKESPLWLKKRLLVCGIRPISSHVDITNYVMLESGMPAHAFDLDKIKGNKLIVRESKKGEKVKTLDGAVHSMPEGVIVFEDAEGIFDLCGIMGGERSGIEKKTKDIFLHNVVYEKTRIRKASIALAHRTDASTIFEKGVPLCSAIEGLRIGLELIKDLYPNAEIETPVLDIEANKKEKKVIDIHRERIEIVTGTKIPIAEIEKNLSALGFTVERDKKDKDLLHIQVPEWRYGDINIEADIIEEIIRIYGINKIEPKYPKIEAKSVRLGKDRVWIHDIRTILSSIGFAECYNYSFLGPELLTKCGLKEDKSHAKIKNYLGEDTSIMRQSLIPQLLDNLASNVRHRDTLRMYELSKTYVLKNDKPIETRMITGLISNDPYNYHEARGAAEAIFDVFKIENLSYVQETKELESYMHPGRTGKIMVDDDCIGYISEIHPEILKNFDIGKRVCFFDINFEKILKYADPLSSYVKLPKYPSAPVDLNILIPHIEPAEKYIRIIRESDKYLVNSARIIDEYIGEQIPEGKRSITVSVSYSAEDRTLTEEEIQKVQSVILQNLEKEGASLRS